MGGSLPSFCSLQADFNKQVPMNETLYVSHALYASSRLDPILRPTRDFFSGRNKHAWCAIFVQRVYMNVTLQVKYSVTSVALVVLTL